MAKGNREFTPAERTAWNAFLAAMDDAEMNTQDLATASGLAYGTAQNWVLGVRWPQRGNLSKMEAAVDAQLRALRRGELPRGSVNRWVRGDDLPNAPTTPDALANISDVDLARELLRRIEGRQ